MFVFMFFKTDCVLRCSSLHESFENLSLHRYASHRRGNPHKDGLVNEEHGKIVNGKVIGGKIIRKLPAV
jgi:hypothetical protein